MKAAHKPRKVVGRKRLSRLPDLATVSDLVAWLQASPKHKAVICACAVGWRVVLLWGDGPPSRERQIKCEDASLVVALEGAARFAFVE